MIKRIKMENDNTMLNEDGHGQDDHAAMDNDKNTELNFNSLDYDSKYLMLKWLDLTELVKFERVSKTFKAICEGHQRRQKVINIGSNFKIKSLYHCDDRSHSSNHEIPMINIDLWPKIISKCRNITALYFNFNYKINGYGNHSKDIFKGIQAFPPKLQHLHLDIVLSEKNLKNLILLLEKVDIKHLTITSMVVELSKSVLESIIRKCPNIEMLCTSKPPDDLWDLLPRLTDYRTVSTSLDMIQLENKMKDQLVKLFIPNIPFGNTMYTIYRMKKLKQLKVGSYPDYPGFYATLHFESTTEFRNDNFKIELLKCSYFSESHLENLDKFPEIRSMQFYGGQYLDTPQMVDMLFKLKGLQVIRGHVDLFFGKCFFKEILKRNTCFKCVIVRHSGRPTDEEYFRALIDLVIKFRKTRFVYECYDHCLFNDINHDLDNLIIKVCLDD